MANEVQGNAGGFKIFMQVSPADGQNGAPAAAPTGPTCVIQYGSEGLQVPLNGRTVRQLFNDNAEALSFERNRTVAFRRNNVICDGGELAQAGSTYVASVTYEQKGL